MATDQRCACSVWIDRGFYQRFFCSRFTPPLEEDWLSRRLFPSLFLNLSTVFARNTHPSMRRSISNERREMKSQRCCLLASLSRTRSLPQPCFRRNFQFVTVDRAGAGLRYRNTSLMSLYVAVCYASITRQFLLKALLRI